jgi:hypothetical protein
LTQPFDNGAYRNTKLVIVVHGLSNCTDSSQHVPGEIAVDAQEGFFLPRVMLIERPSRDARRSCNPSDRDLIEATLDDSLNDSAINPSPLMGSDLCCRHSWPRLQPGERRLNGKR